MKALYQCAKIAHNLQYNIRPLFTLALLFLFLLVSSNKKPDNKLHLFRKLFHAGGTYHIETSPFICRANQWTDFFMI